MKKDASALAMQAISTIAAVGTKKGTFCDLKVGNGFSLIRVKVLDFPIVTVSLFVPDEVGNLACVFSEAAFFSETASGDITSIRDAINKAMKHL